MTGIQFNVTVEGLDAIALGTVVNTTAYYNADDERVEAGRTLGDVIAEQVTARLTKDTAWPDLRARYTEFRDEEIRKAIGPLIQAAIAKPIQQTNAYGSPVGESTTLTELIVKEATAFLTRSADNYNRGGETVLQKWVREQVEKALVKELAEVMAAEKAKVVAAVRGKAAELIADAVRQGLGK
jgi:hypothetical protein